jgi:hypothetical protein
MLAEKGADELAAAALILRIQGAGMASATRQARDVPRRQVGGRRLGSRRARPVEGAAGFSRPQRAAAGPGGDRSIELLKGRLGPDDAACCHRVPCFCLAMAFIPPGTSAAAL